MPDSPTVDAVHLHRDDNICVAARDLVQGQVIQVDGRSLTLTDSVTLGHKIAVRQIVAGDRVFKYGQPIGVATQAISAGQWVHSHNLKNDDEHRGSVPGASLPPSPKPITGRTFQGYRRADGKAGTRNYLAVISTVNCSASVARFVAGRFPADALQDFPNVDGVIGFTHQSGCGIPYQGLGHDMLNRVLGGIARHPNIGGYLLIGLGCEQATIEDLLAGERLVQIENAGSSGQSPPVFTLQDCGGTTRTIEAAVAAIREMLPRVNDVRREPLPASELILATECGGSDGNSGVTANPAVGVAADMLVASGGTAILSETPEIYGAEHLLTGRAVSREVADKLLERIAWWKWYTGIFGAELDNNPSVGNKAGGLTTIAEKSLGAVAKGGTTALRDVYQYAEPVRSKGLVFMDTPGYDPPSVTGMVAGGATVAVFTTGRGSCYGCRPTPTIKVASNTPMFERMIEDMDVNAGEVLTGRSLGDVGQEIFEMILDVAGGQRTKSETHGIGDHEFIPWTVGPTL